MKPMNFRDRWVLVTGASAGLGRTMAGMLARDHGANILAVARRKDRLDALAAELAPTGVKVEVVAADLSKAEDVERVIQRAQEGRQLYGAVLNAGVTYYGKHETLPWAEFEAMLNINVRGTVRLCTALLPTLEGHPDGGGVLLVSSMAGITPLPYQSAYSGTKAFLVAFGTSLAHELEGRRVSVSTYAPGGIRTEMSDVFKDGPLSGWLMDVDQAAREGLEAFRRRKHLHVPGFTYRVGAALIGVLPRQLVGRTLAATYKRALAKTGHV
jgi:short-subunit dehydrogenase